MSTTTKKFYATRDFKDAGTEKSFSLGDDLSAEKGLANYVAAGVASETKPQADKPDATVA